MQMSLTHWGLIKFADILQTFSNVFFWKKIFISGLKFPKFVSHVSINNTSALFIKPLSKLICCKLDSLKQILLP